MSKKKRQSKNNSKRKSEKQENKTSITSKPLNQNETDIISFNSSSNKHKSYKITTFNFAKIKKDKLVIPILLIIVVLLVGFEFYLSGLGINNIKPREFEFVKHRERSNQKKIVTITDSVSNKFNIQKISAECLKSYQNEAIVFCACSRVSKDELEEYINYVKPLLEKEDTYDKETAEKATNAFSKLSKFRTCLKNNDKNLLSCKEELRKLAGNKTESEITAIQREVMTDFLSQYCNDGLKTLNTLFMISEKMAELESKGK